jgi:mannan endo-1,4-beta-mannosidase
VHPEGNRQARGPRTRVTWAVGTWRLGIGLVLIALVAGVGLVALRPAQPPANTATSATGEPDSGPPDIQNTQNTRQQPDQEPDKDPEPEPEAVVTEPDVTAETALETEVVAGTEASGTYRTRGRFLFDPNGSKVVVRGVEQVFWDASWLPTSLVTEVGKSGANAVRVLPYYLQDTPTGEPKSTLAQIEDMIRRGIAAHMLVDIAIDGGRDTAVYLRSEVKELLQRYQRFIVIHAMGESYVDTDEEWVAQAKQTISSMRQAGYTAPLYIMSRTGGRNLPTLLDRGQSVVDADPLHNVVFGWQAYWGSDNHYQNAYGLSLSSAMRRAAEAPFPIQVGIIHHSDPQDNSPQTVPYGELLRLAHELSLGWLWWDWRMGVDDLTTDGRFGNWTQRGLDVVVGGTYSILKTSVRTVFQLIGLPLELR